MFSNLATLLHKGGHLVRVPQQLLHDSPASIPLRDNGTQDSHTVQLYSKQNNKYDSNIEIATSISNNKKCYRKSRE